MTTKRELSHLYEESRFIFKGRVTKLGTSNVRHIASIPSTVLTTVEEVLRGNDVLNALAGKMVTAVLDSGKAAVEPGEVRVFFANGLVYGESVAVRVVGTIEPTEEALGQIKVLKELGATKPLEERVAKADLIVIGRVVGLQGVEKQAAPDSEHDPDWWIANVLVLSTIRGSKTIKEIEVLFANSRDIVWHQAPKLHSGESGLLLLQKLSAAQSPPNVKRSIYQVIDALDFLPVERLQEVKAAIEKVRGR